MVAETTKHPTATIILPTWNGEQDLKRLLPAIAEQDYEGEIEVRAVDSSSSDRSVALLEEAGVSYSVIPQSEFGHGKTRNLCAKEATGDFLVFLSQDVVPQSDFVRRLLEPFEDPRMAGVYGRVLPFPGDDPLTARTVLSLPEASDQPVVRDLDSLDGVWSLDPAERASFLRFNNVASAIRTSVFREIPFPEASFGEDLAWAERALTWGHRIGYAPLAVAFHAHSYSLADAYERYRVDACFHRETHAHLIRPNLFSVLRGIGYEVREDLRYLLKSDAPHKLWYLLRSPCLRTAMVLGQYAGSHGRKASPS